MDFLYEKLLRPMMFQLDPERAHELALRALRLLGATAPLRACMARRGRLPHARYQPVRLFGLEFPNAVGLAAGFDKNAQVWKAAAALGFGHVEIGTVTAKAQPGNPKPRAFRYPRQEALINRMGFNNDGAEAVAARLAAQSRGRHAIPLGINIGKSKVTPIENAVEDYLTSFRLLADHADYIAVNVSSPNTPGLRQLQEKDRLEAILHALVTENAVREKAGRPRRPLLVKIAPDLNWRQIDAIIEVAQRLRLDGLIASNTTLARPGALASANEAGGLSGAPVRERSRQIIHYISRTTHGRLPIIGVGGIMDAAAAGEKLDAGASLVQIYTGLIYRGPFFARHLAKGLAERQLIRPI